MNPFLQRLGFSQNERVVIIHADDFGMCQATLPAIDDLFAAGLLTSTALMVPCPWFLAAAEYCRRVPEADVGVHITLTSEWNGYRWGPLSNRDTSTGLLDREGFFPRGTNELWDQAEPRAVATELRAQLDHALMAGVDVTHIDSHMGAVFDMKFIGSYLALATDYGLPAMLPRVSVDGLRARKLPDDQIDAMMAQQALMEANGIPLVDAIVGMPLDRYSDRVDEARRLLDSVPAGLTHFILHPAMDTPELRHIAPDWQARVADYEAFTSRELSEFVRERGIHLVGYRELRDSMR
jgi:predicted glycoside hydrolase/deacetylase ChbG (UPF0249 family)